MTILGFKIGKKQLIIGGIIILIIFGFSSLKSYQEKKEFAERQRMVEEERKREEEALKQQENQQTLSQAELLQQELIKEWGEPPKGFRWSRQGDLIAVSSEDLTNEQVLYNYLKALSILDFSTVEKYSSTSMVDDTYRGYFSVSGLGRTSYYNQFLRKEYKYALTTLEVEGVDNMAVFANGTSIATVNLEVLDLTDKDFWQKDKAKIFNRLRTYYESESDSAKAEQYVYDYIYDAYRSGKVGKRKLSTEVKLDKVTLGGWLISDDTDIDMALRYDKGLNVADYILKSYTSWYRQQVIKERERSQQ